MNYNVFRDIIGCSPNGHAIIGIYDIEVVLDNDRDYCQWDKELYEETNKYRIYMTGSERTINELLFDFYREVGRISLYHKTINYVKADRYYDKNRIVSPNDRYTLVENMTLDEFATVQLQYSIKPANVLPLATITTMKILYPYKDDDTIKALLEMHNESILIRRKYMNYIFETNKKSMNVPKVLAKLNIGLDRPKLVGDKAKDAVKSLNAWAEELGYTNNHGEQTKKPIQVIMQKMKLHDRGVDFESNIRRIIRSYNGDIDIISTEHFIVKIKKDETPMDKIKTYYNKYHDIVHDYIVPLYDKYKSEYNPDIRYKYQCVIEKILIDFIDGITPSDETVQEIIRVYDHNNNNSNTTINPKTAGMMTWKERQKILHQAINDVAERFNIKNYVIKDEYGLNNKMNRIVDLYCVDTTSHKIDDIILPFLERSGA